VSGAAAISVRVAVFAQRCGYAMTMGATTVVTALTGLLVLFAVVATGVMIVLGGRTNEQRVSERVRRFFTDRRREGPGL